MPLVKLIGPERGKEVDFGALEKGEYVLGVNDSHDNDNQGVLIVYGGEFVQDMRHDESHKDKIVSVVSADAVANFCSPRINSDTFYLGIKTLGKKGLIKKAFNEAKRKKSSNKKS